MTDTNTQNWEHLQNLFFTALDMESAERAAWLDALSRADPVSAREVGSMLHAHLEAASLRIETGLDAPAHGTGGIPDAVLQPGSTIGPYRIDALLGTGGMAHVYRAERSDGLYTQAVALKVLRPGYHAAEFIRLFESERHILARLQHPDIAAILGGGTTQQGLPWLAMQLVEGLPITRHCSECNVPLRDRLRLFVRVCEAVQFAHARLIVHRDLKASNIMVTPAGDPVLLDFGIAKLLSPEPDNALYTPTRTGVRIMTPEHAAPEQLAGEPVSTATDVYALGLLLVELLTDRRPANTVASLHAANGDGADDAASPGAILRRSGHADIAGDLDRIVAMALRTDPVQRYASAGQFADDVQRCLAGLPVRAQPDSARYRARKFVRRHRVMLTAAAAVALLLAGSTAASLVQARRVAVERDIANAERAESEAVIGLLTSLFESSNPRIVPGGDTVRVAAVLEQAEAEVERLEGQPELQARMWRVLGTMHAARSRLDRAVDLLTRSHSLHVDLYGTDDVRTARTAHDLARATHGFSGSAAAVPLLRESADRLARLLGAAHGDAVVALQDLAIATPDADERSVLLARVAELRSMSDSGDATGMAAVFNAQAGEHLEHSRYAEALALYRQSAATLDNVIAPDHPNRLTVAGNMVSTLTLLGRYDEAEPLARSVLEARLRVLGEESSEVAGARESLATVLTNLGRLDEAERLFRQSLAVFERTYAPGHWRTSSALRNIGMITVLRGDPVRALLLLDSAIAMMPDRTGTAHMRAQRAIPLMRLGRIGDARTAAAGAAAVIDSITPEGHAYRSAIAVLLGTIALAQRRTEEAEFRYRTALALRQPVLPSAHPELAEAECGVAVSRALLRPSTSAAPPHEACIVYARWGRADETLLDFAGLPHMSGNRR